MRFLLSFVLVMTLLGAGAGAAVVTGIFTVEPTVMAQIVGDDAASEDGATMPRLQLAQAQTGAPPVPLSPPPAQPGAAAQTGAPAQPQAPVETARQEIGDWIYSCATIGDGSQRCAISQQLSDSQSNATVLLWRMVRAPDSSIVANWQTPTGILVERGMLLAAGTPQPVRVPYRSCSARSCEAVATLADDFLQTLAATTEIAITIVAEDGNAVTIPMSVDGLAQALTTLRQ